ncbi:MAG: dethiobiotin synthase [Pseudomonadota bacterium]
MIKGFTVTGTDTDVGKTVFSAMLAQAIGATYYKPIQAGVTPSTDLADVKRLSGLAESHFLPETYRLALPASPHFSAEQEGVDIDPGRLGLPDVAGALVVEGAGGLCVPVTRRLLYIDLFAEWGLPVILCARTALGTINHSLLSVEALKRRGIALHGIVFIGDENADSQRTILDFSGARGLGRLPLLLELNPQSLKQAFTDHFKLEDFVPA